MHLDARALAVEEGVVFSLEIELAPSSRLMSSIETNFAVTPLSRCRLCNTCGPSPDRRRMKASAAAVNASSGAERPRPCGSKLPMVEPGKNRARQPLDGSGKTEGLAEIGGDREHRHPGIFLPQAVRLPAQKLGRDVH
jgi:hypothetical protein